MKLFHQLEEKDQQNSVHYCLHIVIEDLLNDGVELEAHTSEDEKVKSTLIKVVEKAKELPKEEQFGYVMDSAASELVFDIALDMARAAYYHSSDDMVIHYEELRPGSAKDESLNDDDDINTLPKKGKHSLN